MRRLEEQGVSFRGEGVPLRPFVLGAMVGAESFKNGGVRKNVGLKGFLYSKIRAFIERKAVLVLEFGREED